MDGTPKITLRCGAHRVDIFDPRPDPYALGSRYVHGGYVSAWWYGDRCLTARPTEAWDPYVGEGLPEVFEFPLGRDAVQRGDEFLRIGAGRLCKDEGGWPQAGGTPSSPVHWTVMAQSADAICMRCTDELGAYRYTLERSVRVDADGVESCTSLELRCPWSSPIYWFAHPFFAHGNGAATALHLPEGCRAGYQLGADGGFGAVTNVWGYREPLLLDLDGGGQVVLGVDRPLDKLIVYATARAFSVEPYLARAWHDGERAEWSIRYRFLPAGG